MINDNNNKREILKNILCCPKCKEDLEYFTNKCICRSCKSIYPIIDNKFFFRDNNNINTEITNYLDKIKYKFKKYATLYSFLVKVISPVYSHKKLLKNIVSKSKIQLNIGSGNTLLSENIINCDYFDYDKVDVVLDATMLPFKSGSIESIINIALLEHIPKPNYVINEIYRSLKRNGEIFSVIPFMQPYHASPNDYQRFTITGIKQLHSKFFEIEYGVFSGPISGFLWVIQEFLAIILSFGNHKLHDLIYLIFMTLTFPIKYLDFIFARFNTADILASSFYFYGRKICEK